MKYKPKRVEGGWEVGYDLNGHWVFDSFHITWESVKARLEQLMVK